MPTSIIGRFWNLDGLSEMQDCRGRGAKRVDHRDPFVSEGDAFSFLAWVIQAAPYLKK